MGGFLLRSPACYVLSNEQERMSSSIGELWLKTGSKGDPISVIEEDAGVEYMGTLLIPLGCKGSDGDLWF